jgi:TRAP-type mannitol/chloroaromatic compound transport system permease small subunit
MTALFARCIQWMSGAGVVWIFALTFLICADIVGRTLFDSPLQAVAEIVSLSLIGCVFLQIAYAIQTDRLTKADVLFSRIRARQPAVAAAATQLFALAGCIVFTDIAIGAWPDFWRALRTSEFVGVEGIYTLPVAPVKFFVVLGTVAAALTYFAALLRSVRSNPGRSAVLAAGIALACCAVIALAWLLLPSDRQIGVIAIATVFLLIGCGFPIAVVLLLVGLLGLALLKRDFGIATDSSP